MKKFLSCVLTLDLVLIGCLLLPSSKVLAQLPSFTVDPCANPGAAKTSFAVAARAQITTATTTLLSAVVTGKQHFVCHYEATIGGTASAGTIQFEYGTQTTTPCDTGTTTITPALNTNSSLSTFLWGGGGLMTIFSTPASQQLCVVSTVGTGPSIAVWGTEVVQ